MMSSSTSISDTNIVVFDPFKREMEETDRNKDRQKQRQTGRDRQTETGRQTDRQTTDREIR